MSESYEAVLEAVQGLLNAPPPALPQPVGEVVAFRSAARRVAESNLSKDKKARLAILLGGIVREAVIPEWCRRAAWEELYGQEDPPLPPITEERAARTLRNLGFDTCPTCKRRNIAPVELDRRDRERRWAVERAEVRRKAVPV